MTRTMWVRGGTMKIRVAVTRSTHLRQPNGWNVRITDLLAKPQVTWVGRSLFLTPQEAMASCLKRWNEAESLKVRARFQASREEAAKALGRKGADR